MIEEKIIPQNANNENSGDIEPTITSEKPKSPDLEGLKKEYNEKIAQYEQKIALQKEDFKNKLNSVYEKKEEEERVRKQKGLQEQGAWKPLWEEANQTNQKKDQTINDLQKQLEELKISKEQESVKNAALSAISNSGAINAEQILSLLQNKLQRNEKGEVVILNGGVEQDFTSFVNNLKNPGSGWEHHFKASNAAGMGVTPNPSNTSGTGNNPWKSGNLTQQLIMENENPDLAAVLKREAQKR